MARVGITAAVQNSTYGSIKIGSKELVVDPAVGMTFASTQATLVADLATLVADGASPTQAHVTAVNSDYTAFAATLGVAPVVRDVIVSIDIAKVVSVNVLEEAFREIVKTIRGSGLLKP